MTVKVTKPAVNLREKLAELQKPSGVAGEAMLRAETPQEQFNLIGAGRKNLVINGGFDVWQRGTSWASVTSGYYADRWNVVRSHTVGVDRVSCDLDGFKYAHRTTNVTAGVPTLYHNVENTGQFYEGQTLTLSFWLRASEVQRLRSGRTYDGSTFVTNYHSFYTSTEWKYYSFTITPTSDWAGTETFFGVQVFASDGVDMSAGSWIEVTGVQLELGKVATPFEHRSYGEELALCQRYYYKISSEVGGNRAVIGTGSTYQNDGNFYVPVRFPVTMRSAPTVTNSVASDFLVRNGASTAVVAVGLQGNTAPHGANLIFDTAATTAAKEAAWVETNVTTSAAINFDAEL